MQGWHRVTDWKHGATAWRQFAGLQPGHARLHGGCGVAAGWLQDGCGAVVRPGAPSVARSSGAPTLGWKTPRSSAARAPGAAACGVRRSSGWQTRPRAMQGLYPGGPISLPVCRR